MANANGSVARTTGLIAVGDDIAGDLTSSTTPDTYEIALVAGQSYLIDLKGLPSGSGTLPDPYLRLRDPAGTLIAVNDDFGGTRNSELRVTATTTGTYVVEADGFAGATGTYRLSVANVSPLVLVASPDNQTGVSTTSLTLTFSDAVTAGTGTIVIRRAADGAAMRTIAAGDGSQAAFSGNALVLTPTLPLAEKTAYYVTVAASAVVGPPGHTFAGITSPTAVNFVTGDFTAPTLVKTTPADGTLGVAPGANIVLTFSEAVKAGSGGFGIYDVNGGALVWQAAATLGGQVTFAGTTVTLNPPADLVAGRSYYVIVDAAAVSDVGGHAFAGVSDPAELTFTVRDLAAPKLVGATPSDNAIDVPPDGDIVLNFSEAVIAGSGNIVIRRTSDNAIVRSIAVGDTSQVTFAGPTVVINPAAGLADGTGYYVTMAPGVIRDLTGNALAGLTLPTQLNFTTSDLNPPLLVASTPADGTLGVAPGANIVLKFNEGVKAGLGSVRISNADGTLFRSIAITDRTQVTFAGSVVTVNPSVDLVPGASYRVTLDPGAVLDRFGNPFAGILDVAPLDFTVSDIKAPLLVSSLPATKSSGVAVGSSIVLTFNEAVTAGSGNILIRRAADNAVVKTIAAGDTTQVTFAGNVVTIDPAADLVDGTSYYVTLAAGVIADLSGAKFAGLTLPTQLAFQTADLHAPLLLASSPAPGAVNVAANANLVLTFNETVKAGSGSISIWRADGTLVRAIASTDTTQVSIAGRTVTINPAADLGADVTGYYVTIDAGAFKDAFNNAFAGISDATSFAFTTRDAVAPKLVASTPADNAAAVAEASTLVLTFSEAVQAGSGNIVIHKADGSVVRTIAVTDTSQVTVSGTSVTIDPATDLPSGAALYVTLAAGVLKDLAGNAFAGITGAAALNFTTADTKVPLLVSATPADKASGVGAAANITLTFNEAMKKGSGTIAIHDAASGAVVWSAAVGSSAVSIAGAVVTINPPSNLSNNSSYYVTVDGGALSDLAGNAYAGFTSSTDLRFSTRDTIAPTLLSSNPADGDTDVAADADIVLHFSETVVGDGLGSIGIYKIVGSQGILVDGIAPTDTSQITISGGTVTINPNVTLEAGQSYFLAVDTLAFKDLAGNHYGGLDINTEPIFTVAGLAAGDDYTASLSTTGVVAVGGTAQGKIEVYTDYDWFRVHLDAGTTYDITEVSIGRTGGVNDPYITGIYDSTGALIPGTSNDDFNGKDSLVSFTPTATGDYFVEAASYGSNTGTYQVGVAVHGTVAADTTAPTLLSSTPADNGSAVDPQANLTLRFSELVEAGSGNIVITADGGGDTRTISAADPSQVSFSNGTVTINPTAVLTAGAHYSVTIDAGAITDASGNPYAGIGDPTAFDFQTVATAATSDAWTIMIYVAGDNNLETFGISDINEMEQANLPDNVNVVFLFDRTPGYDTTNGNWTDTRVGAVSYDGGNPAIGTNLTSWGELDTGAPSTLTRFINWGTTTYAASHYGLVVWDHGSGLDGVAWDDTSNDNLTMSELRGAIASSTVGHLDVIGFDACLQAMTEQAFDLRSQTNYVVASEELVPGPGWAYDRWLGALGADPGMSGGQLATAMVDSYGQEYAGTTNVTLSATDTSKLGALETSLDAFVAAALALPVSSADWATMRTEAAASHFYPSDDATYRYRDLGDFMQSVATHVSDTTLGAAAADVVTTLDAAVIAQAGTVAAASGLSIYMPYGSQAVRSDYTSANYLFLQQVHWDSFLSHL